MNARGSMKKSLMIALFTVICAVSAVANTDNGCVTIGEADGNYTITSCSTKNQMIALLTDSGRRAYVFVPAGAENMDAGIPMNVQTDRHYRVYSCFSDVKWGRVWKDRRTNDFPNYQSNMKNVTCQNN
jgi:hypothetical protein